MIIRHRGIYKDRFDAPFIGTMIAAARCTARCKGCFHEDRREDKLYAENADTILDRVLEDIFSEGIILGFLEWLDGQYDEALYMIEGAMKRGLQVILYTRRTEEELRKYYPRLFTYSGLYIKVGKYDESKRVHDYMSYGVPLATSNQYIIQVP